MADLRVNLRGQGGQLMAVLVEPSPYPPPLLGRFGTHTPGAVHGQARPQQIKSSNPSAPRVIRVVTIAVGCQTSGSQVKPSPGGSMHGPGWPECSQGVRPVLHSKITFAAASMASRSISGSMPGIAAGLALGEARPPHAGPHASRAHRSNRPLVTRAGTALSE